MASKTESTLIGGGGGCGADTGKVVAEVCGTADAADDEEDAVAAEAVDVKGDGARAAAIDDDVDDENGDCIGAPLKAGAFETPEKGRLSPTDGVDGANAFGVGVFIGGGAVDAVEEEVDAGAVNGDAADGACLCPKAGVLNTTGTADAGMVFDAALTGVVTAAVAAGVLASESVCDGCGCGGANGDGVRAVAEKAFRAANGVSDVVGSAAADEVEADAGANVDVDTADAAGMVAVVDVDDEDEV
jgi:hypothetical protein